MKKTLTALVMAASLIMAPATTFATEETEAASSEFALQGIDDQNNIWTVAINSENQVAAVCLQIPDEDGSYPEENYVVVSGPVEIGEDYMSIKDDEDGLDYVFGMTDVEGTDNQVEMTYEPTNSVVILSVIDQETVAKDDNMVYYAGFDENGTQWTVGFDFDNSVIAINAIGEGGSATVAGTFEDDENGTLTITAEDGSVNTLNYVAENEDWTTLTLTDEDGVSITVSYVNPDVLENAA